MTGVLMYKGNFEADTHIERTSREDEGREQSDAHKPKSTKDCQQATEGRGRLELRKYQSLQGKFWDWNPERG